jgi:hypothetical protein
MVKTCFQPAVILSTSAASPFHHSTAGPHSLIIYPPLVYGRQYLHQICSRMPPWIPFLESDAPTARNAGARVGAPWGSEAGSAAQRAPAVHAAVSSWRAHMRRPCRGLRDGLQDARRYWSGTHAAAAPWSGRVQRWLHGGGTTWRGSSSSSSSLPSPLSSLRLRHGRIRVRLGEARNVALWARPLMGASLG